MLSWAPRAAAMAAAALLEFNIAPEGGIILPDK